MTPPLVGRSRELSRLTAALDEGRMGRGSAHLVSGEGGIGKTRLTLAVAARARERGYTTITGRAFPVETGIPYALFADGFVPLLREMSPAALQTLTRGAMTELGVLFPTLRPEGADRARASDPVDLKARLLDTFAGILARLTERQPLLLVLENLQWADPSSLDLFHFVARSVRAQPLVMLATHNDAQREANRGLRAAERSLTSLGVLERHALSPLTAAETEELVLATFGEQRDAIGDFGERVHARTRGNPFFVEETLKALVASGRIRREGERWVGWSTEQLAMPDSIRDALSLRYEALSERAQRLVQVAAAVGTHVPHALLARLGGGSAAELLSTIEELLREHLFEETMGAAGPAYLFTHPLMQEMLYAEISRARAQRLHGEIGDALEGAYGADALAHAEELAVHFHRADVHDYGERAVRYLVEAGRLALARGADREAVESLEAARARVAPTADQGVRTRVHDLLARARMRTGDYVGAARLIDESLQQARSGDDAARVATLERRLAVAVARRGDIPAALAHLDAGLAAAARAADPVAATGLHLARSSALLDVGRGAEAEADARRALAIATPLGDAQLLARVHLALQSLGLWQGPSTAALEHGERALALAAECGDVHAACNARLTLAMHAGLTGDAVGTARHLEAASELAERARSPILRLWTAEVSIEYRSGVGEWDGALALADRTIEEARSFSQVLLLPRLLVWSALVHLGRGDFDEAKRRIDEAWELSGADRAEEDETVNVHTAVPAHVGLGYYHLYRKEYRQALKVGERGLAIADRTGYTVWSVYRLLPLVAESSLWLNDWEGALAFAKRLRDAADRLGHPLARAWADATTALEMRFTGDVAGAITRLREAAGALEAIPFREHAARLRRKLVEPLVQLGDTPGAIRELHAVHEVFARLGARPALDEVREKMRELGARPPALVPTVNAGVGALTPREHDVARLAAAGSANKEIGVALGISKRTVDTHLANIFKKLNVTSRVALSNHLRDQGA
ncbi:MAG: AAA family ATPase [Gemmatimonadetes bacterium]|nr:AAA family ATPase [Gemmatimonadota bacterium]